MKLMLRTMLGGAAMLSALPAYAQDPAGDPAAPDRAEPAVVEQDVRDRDPRPARSPQGRLQAPAVSAPAASVRQVVAGAIRILGSREIPMIAFAPVIERYLGRPLDQADLTRLATEIAAVARGRGYGLATAWVPAQDVAGMTLVVQVEEGRIDAVRATGPGSATVERRLSGVIGDRPVRTAELERQLLIAGDVAGLRVGNARLVQENGRNILVVATSFEQVSGRASIDNWGSDAVGPVRARVSVHFNGFVLPGDQITLGAATTPLEPRELQLFDARYRVPVGNGGTQIGVGGYFGHTRAGGDSRDRDLAGDSSEIDVELSHPLVRSRARSIWLGGRLAMRDSQLEEHGRLIRDDRLTTASAWLYATSRLAGGTLRGRLTGVQGLDLLDATRRGDRNASRTNAGGVFTKLEYWGDYLRPLGGGFSLELAARGQFADRALLSSEEIGLGGRQFLRAFDYREASGDDGASGSIELRFDLRDLPRPLKRAQFYVYADGGRVGHLSSTRASEGLASAGGGVRVHLRGGFEAGVEVGIPLTEGNFDRNSGPRFSFSVTAAF